MGMDMSTSTSVIINKLGYNWNTSDKVTKKAKFIIVLNGDDYIIVNGQVKCVFYYLKDLQWSQGNVEEVVEKNNPELYKSGYTYFKLGNLNPDEQVKERLSSNGITVLSCTGSSLGSLVVEILTNDYTGSAEPYEVDTSATKKLVPNSSDRDDSNIVE